MSSPRSRRARRLALAAALLGMVGVGAASGVVAWRRAHGPWRTFRFAGRPRVFFGADGALVVRVDSPPQGFRGPLHVLDVASGAEVRVVTDARWSSGPSRFLRIGDGPLVLEEPSSGARRTLLDSKPAWWGAGFDFQLSADASVVAVVSFSLDEARELEPPASIELRSLGKSPQTRPLEKCGVDEMVSTPMFSLRGDKVAAMCGAWTTGERSVRIWSAVTGALEQELKATEVCLGFASTGEVVVAAHRGEELFLVAADGSARHLGLPLAWSDDPWEVSASRERLASLQQDAIHAEGKLDADGVFVHSLVTGALLRCVPCVPRQPPRTSFGWTECGSVALSPRGDFLALGFWDGSVEVWEIPSE